MTRRKQTLRTRVQRRRLRRVRHTPWAVRAVCTTCKQHRQIATFDRKGEAVKYARQLRRKGWKFVAQSEW